MSWDISGKSVLITGGNCGIGYATALELARRGAKVTITARDPRRGAEALETLRAAAPQGAVEAVSLDLAQFASIKACAEEILARQSPLRVLINNAGLVQSKRSVTAEGFETTFGVNHLGPFYLTSLLLERLQASAPARVITVASKAYTMAGPRGLDFDDLQNRRRYDALQAYGRSKLANIYFAQELARRLAGSGVTSNVLHPGVVASRFGRDGDMSGPVGWMTWLILALGLSPASGARTSLHLATAPELSEVSGQYFRRSRPAKLRRIARDREAAGRLWAVSEALVEQGRP